MLVTAVAWDDPDATALRAAQRIEIEQRYGTPDSEPGQAPSAADITYFVVARRDGVAVGCGGLRQLDETSGEIKRMYVLPDHRGTGVSTALLRALEAHARALGWTHLRLETGTNQPDAVRFYTREGYRPIPGFGHYVEPASLCFERALA
jgi:GNAT superfamily N-acetyltransferase